MRRDDTRREGAAHAGATPATAAGGPGFAIVPYRPAFRDAFERLNRAWLAELWVEPRDERVFADPEGAYVATGGAILVALPWGDVPGAPGVASAGTALDAGDPGVIGTVALRREDAGLWELCKLAVDARVRGRGIGDALVRAVIAAAHARGARRVVLTTNTKLAAAVRLYRRHGFAEVPVRAYPERARADLEMALALAAPSPTHP